MSKKKKGKSKVNMLIFNKGVKSGKNQESSI